MYVLIILLLIVIILLGGIIAIYFNIKNKISSFSQSIFNTPNIIEGFKENEKYIQETPKTVSGGDSMFIDNIKKDFPEFNLSNAKNVISKCIKEVHTSSKTSISNEYPDILLQLDSTINRKIIMVKIHKIAIFNYEKSYNDANVKFQCAYEVVFDNSEKKQLKAEIDYCFALNSNQTLKCPHCGGPVTKMGIKNCEFCGHGIVYDIDDTWIITKIKNL